MKIKCVFALFTASLFFLLLSCTKEGNEESISKNYSITYNGHYSSATIDVFEYDKNDPSKGFRDVGEKAVFWLSKGFIGITSIGMENAISYQKPMYSIRCVQDY